MPTKHEIVVRPLITEKTSAAYHVRGEYAFVVHPEATKTQIRAAIENLFGVKVLGVWTASQAGKEKRVGRTVGRGNKWKKAIVKLREGDTIPNIFEG